MFRNYLTIALRNLRKHSFYSLINVVGLAIGVSACLIIVLFLIDELSYDKYNTKSDRIFRLHNEVTIGNTQFKMATSAAPVANTLQADYPEIEATVRFRLYGSYLVKTEEGIENIKELNVAWVDSTFFKIFTVPVLEGNAEQALKEPRHIAISKRIADKYFPGRSALGQSLILDNNYHATVSAVYDNIPSASHFHFDILISMMGDWPVAKEARSTVYSGNNGFFTYLLLKEGTDVKSLENKLDGFIEKYIHSTIKSSRQEKSRLKSSLMPLPDIHLYSNMGGEIEANSSITYVYLMSIIALFILAIACVNFMNLSTAQSANRAKEVGVRKVMGSLRSNLIRQFLTESILITLFAFILAIGLAYAALPLFNDLSLKKLHIPFKQPIFYVALGVNVLIVGLLAGLYPSFFLSAFKPARVLKGHVSFGMKSGTIRSALVVFQFVTSIVLIIGAITVNKQLNYIQTRKLGFDKDQVFIIKDAYALRPNVHAFKNEVIKISSVESCSVSGFLPIAGSDASRNDRSFWKEGNEPTTDNLVSLQSWRIDFDYIKTMGMNIKEGRDFSLDFPSDSYAVIINEAAVLQFGLGDDPIGKKISSFYGKRQDDSFDPDQSKSFTVIGVVKDFHFSSLKETIGALGLFIAHSDGFIITKIKTGQAKEAISAIEKRWKEIAPDQPFQYSFLDEEFGRMYAAEERLGKIFTLFATLAIVIACLGLFALTAYIAEQRTKEIGIRKVLGASVNSIIFLLSKEFGKLILIAFVLATPIAWYGINMWLDGYSYKTEIGIGVYLLAGAFVLFIAWLTMSFQSIKAASSDPVKALKSE